MRISDWSSDVCSSDLERAPGDAIGAKPVEDRPVEARRGGDRGVGMERIIVAREAVDQRLLGPGCKFGALVRGRGDRKSVVWGKSVSVRVDLGGRGIIKKKKTIIS